MLARRCFKQGLMSKGVRQLARGFGGGGHHPAEKNDSHPAHEHENELTKEELFKHLNPVERYAFDVTNRNTRHTPANPSASAPSILRRLSPHIGTRLVKYLHKETNTVDAERPVADSYNPPKVHENGVFLYQSEDAAARLKRSRHLELAVYTGFCLVVPNPVFGIATLAILYWSSGRARKYERSNRLVTRMDLLPHLESIAFQKVGFLGRTVTSVVSLSNLEKFEPAFGQENAFWAYNVDLNRDLVYRNKATGEIYCFDSDGVWDWQGISHPLLY